MDIREICEKRAELMKAFGGTRKVWTPVKTAA